MDAVLNHPIIKLSDALGPFVRNVVALARSYDTIILLYEDDFSDRILAAWAELDRLNIHTRKIGEVYGGIEVHTFGMEDFPPGSIITLYVREARGDVDRQDIRRIAYKSLLNELALISVKVS